MTAEGTRKCNVPLALHVKYIKIRIWKQNEREPQMTLTSVLLAIGLFRLLVAVAHLTGPEVPFPHQQIVATSNPVRVVYLQSAWQTRLSFQSSVLRLKGIVELQKKTSF